MSAKVYSDGRMYGATVEERLMARARASESGCLEWQGRTAGGYGRIDIDGANHAAHRVSYALHVGPIPVGMTVDHLCFNRACIEPTHLRLLTLAENSANRRPWTHCKNGHEFTPENTATWGRSGFRRCRTCAREVTRQKRRANRKADTA